MGRRAAGLTLVEVVVAVAVLGVVAAGLHQVALQFTTGYHRVTGQAYARERAAAVLRVLLDGSGEEPGLRAAREVRVAPGGEGIAYLAGEEGRTPIVVEYFRVGSRLYRSVHPDEGGWPRWAGGTAVLEGVRALSVSWEGGTWRIVLCLEGEPSEVLVTGVRPRN